MPGYVNDNYLQLGDEISKQIIWNRRKRAVASIAVAALVAGSGLVFISPLDYALWVSLPFILLAVYFEHRARAAKWRIASGKFGPDPQEMDETMNAALEVGDRLVRQDRLERLTDSSL